MTKKLLFILMAVSLCGPAWAGPIDDAAFANERGDYAAELKITRPLALKGEAWAQFFLGESYRVGKGVAKNDAEAVKWYRLAAEQGYAIAQFNLGVMYKAGQGVLQDYTKSHAFLNLAATNGDTDAGKFRDIVAKRMTPQQIADAQKMARDCLASNFKGCD